MNIFDPLNDDDLRDHEDFYDPPPSSPIPPSSPPSQAQETTGSTPRGSAASVFLDPAYQAYHAVSNCTDLAEMGINLSSMFKELKTLADAVTTGDMKHPEAMALSQATALNVIFSRISSFAFQDMKNAHFASLMRLAFRAQSQCSRTLETLTSLKNPSVFAHQLNIAGQQLIANGPIPAGPPPPELTDGGQNLVRLAHPPGALPLPALQEPSTGNSEPKTQIPHALD